MPRISQDTGLKMHTSSHKDASLPAFTTAENYTQLTTVISEKTMPLWSRMVAAWCCGEAFLSAVTWKLSRVESKLDGVEERRKPETWYWDRASPSNTTTTLRLLPKLHRRGSNLRTWACSSQSPELNPVANTQSCSPKVISIQFEHGHEQYCQEECSNWWEICAQTLSCPQLPAE